MDYIKNWDDNLVLNHIGCEFNIIHNYFQQKNIKDINYVDIGANVGKYHDMFKQHGYNINLAVMVEPCLDLYEYMVNKFKNNKECFIHNFALSEFDGTTWFETYEEKFKKGKILDFNNLGIAAYGYNYVDGQGIETKIYSGFNFFKNFVEPHNKQINLIKIDTETRDIDILKSLIDYLKNIDKKPFIIFEKNYRPDLIDVAREVYSSYITELNYKGVPFDDTSSAVFLYPNE
jgi:FkbM family methyltransferase